MGRLERSKGRGNYIIITSKIKKSGKLCHSQQHMCVWINLTDEVKDLYNENFKLLKNKLKKVSKDGRPSMLIEVVRLML